MVTRINMAAVMLSTDSILSHIGVSPVGKELIPHSGVAGENLIVLITLYKNETFYAFLRL